MRKLLLCIAFGTYSAVAQPMNLLELRYDPHADSLLATLAFRGTRPYHHLYVKWGECQNVPGNPAEKEIAGRIVDANGADFALQSYVVVSRFDLSGLGCRPASVTLITSTGARRTVEVPAAP